MLDLKFVKQRVHSLSLLPPDALIVCMAVEGLKNQRPVDICKIALAAGFVKASTWNISRELNKRPDQVIRTPDGWELTPAGMTAAEKSLGLDLTPKVLSAAVISLRKHIEAVNTDEAKAFLSESVSCLEDGLLRAAVVLTWVGAVAILQREVVTKHLANFNHEARKRDPKWRDAKDSDGLSRMQEFDFLNVLEAISMIGKNVKQELEGCLKLRNGCGHPNSLRIGENKVAAHIETIIQNVFMRFI